MNDGAPAPSHSFDLEAPIAERVTIRWRGPVAAPGSARPSTILSPVDLERALGQFERVETNLERLERVLEQIEELIPDDIRFSGSTPEGRQYENLARAYDDLLAGLPAIAGYKIQSRPLALDDIAQNRYDSAMISEPDILIGLDQQIAAPAQEVAAYRHSLMRERRSLVRARAEELMVSIDAALTQLTSRYERDQTPLAADDEWQQLVGTIAEVERLVGPDLVKRGGWGDLARHFHFALGVDLHDIADSDWPSVRPDIENALYGQLEPLPVDAEDLAELVATRPAGPVSTALMWSALDDDSFERLVFNILQDAAGYENPRWLMKTRAPDRGRDLSVDRVVADSLSGTRRERVIVQCKHWQSRSVTAQDCAATVAQMSLWEPPAVDELIIATSGRFTSDAVRWIDAHNENRKRPHVDPWPDSHLESLLAPRPGLVGEFGLRSS